MSEIESNRDSLIEAKSIILKFKQFTSIDLDHFLNDDSGHSEEARKLKARFIELISSMREDEFSELSVILIAEKLKAQSVLSFMKNKVQK